MFLFLSNIKEIFSIASAADLLVVFEIDGCWIVGVIIFGFVIVEINILLNDSWVIVSGAQALAGDTDIRIRVIAVEFCDSFISKDVFLRFAFLSIILIIVFKQVVIRHFMNVILVNVESEELLLLFVILKFSVQSFQFFLLVG